MHLVAVNIKIYSKVEVFIFNKMFIKTFFIYALCNICLHSTVAFEKKKTVCYHGSWSFNRHLLGKFDISEHMDPLYCTHLIYAFFGITNTGEIKSRNVQLDFEENNGFGNLRKFNDLKLKNPDLKTLLSVGGWNAGSANFSIVAADPHKRQTFFNSTMNFLQKYGFDGIDIDWEYPNQRHDFKNNDSENFVIWLKELKEGFQRHDFILTAAVDGVKYNAEKFYNVSEIAKYLDFMNVMSYALNGVWHPTVGMNSPLYAGPTYLSDRAKQRNFDAIAKYLIQQGVPREKIVMGVAFYGRSFTLESAINHNVGANHTGVGIAGPYTKQPGIIAYNELCEKLLLEKSQWHLEWEPNQMLPYAFNDLQWIGYENEKSLALKVDYVKRENLGGMIVWTVEMDDFRAVCSNKRFPLLSIITEGLAMNKTTFLRQN